MNIDRVRDHIRAEILNDPELELGAEDDLLLSQTLDSLGVVRLVQFLEGEYGLQVPAEDVTLEHFSTLSKIDAYLRTRGVGEA